MASISSLGAGSGLDLNGLLTNLMQAEQQPLVAMQKQEASYQATLSALGSLSGSLSSLQTAAATLIPATGKTAAAAFTNFNASVADTTIASASATTGAVAGSYSLEVTKLALAQRLATPTPGGTSPYASATAALATGTLKIEFGALSGGTYTADATREKSIVIDTSNNTLAGLRDAINAANAGVSATIVAGSSGAQLILTSNGTGNSNVMRLSGLAGFDYDPAADSGTLTQSAASGGQAAQDAQFKLNGISATSSSNSVSGVLDGVTLNLLKTNENNPTTVTITKDTSTNFNNALSTFIKAYNDANKTMRTMGAYDATTKVAGALQGNATLLGAQNSLKKLFSDTVGGGNSVYQRLADIGVSTARDGTLSLDMTKLKAAASADFDGVANVVTAIGNAFKNTLDGIIGSSGSITTATDGTNRMIKDIKKREDDFSQQLTLTEARYRAQFTALDSMVASMNRTSSYLSQQLASLPSASASSSSSA